jgi:hypothetical protein
MTGTPRSGYPGAMMNVFDVACWSELPASGTTGVPVTFATSPNVTNGQATTQQITPSTTFAAGQIYTTHTDTPITIPVGGATELEAVIEATDEASDEERLRFRVVRVV